MGIFYDVRRYLALLSSVLLAHAFNLTSSSLGADTNQFAGPYCGLYSVYGALSSVGLTDGVLSRWDGTALAVSDTPIDVESLTRPDNEFFLIVVFWAVFMIWGGRCLVRWLASPALAQIMLSPVRQAALIFVAAILIGLVSDALSPDGFLRNAGFTNISLYPGGWAEWNTRSK